MNGSSCHSSPVPIPLPPQSLADLFAEYSAHQLLVRNVSAGVVRSHQLYLKRIGTSFSANTTAEFFSALTPRRIMAVVSEYASMHGAASRREFLTTLRTLLRFCHARGYVINDICAWVPPFHYPRLALVPKAIPELSITQLLASIDVSKPPGLRDRAIIQLLVSYGVRGAHIRHLLLSDVDWDNGRIRFAANKRGKEIIQPLTLATGTSLCEYLCRERPPSLPWPELFVKEAPPYCPFASAQNLTSMITQRLRLAGIELPEGVSHGTHSFRHAFATRLCGKVPFKVITDMLGHRGMSAALVYTKVDFAALSQTALPWPQGGVQ